MSEIRGIYHNGPPNFPATDQHPDAVRYTVGAYIVDAIGGQPTQAEVDVVLNRSPRSLILAQLAEIDRLTMSGVRGLREFILAQAQLTDYLISGGTLPVPGPLVSDNLGMQKVAQLEAQAALLRAQLAVLP